MRQTVENSIFLKEEEENWNLCKLKIDFSYDLIGEQRIFKSLQTAVHAYFGMRFHSRPNVSRLF